jgi:hypothetical protein
MKHLTLVIAVSISFVFVILKYLSLHQIFLSFIGGILATFYGSSLS